MTVMTRQEILLCVQVLALLQSLEIHIRGIKMVVERPLYTSVLMLQMAIMRECLYHKDYFKI